MKYLLPILLLTACEQIPTGPAIESEPLTAEPTTLAAGPVMHTYSVAMVGDGITFTLSLFTDLNLPTEQQLVVGPVTLAIGQTLTYSVTGYNFIGDNGVTQSGFSRVSGAGGWLIATVSKDGVAAEVKQLSTNGTYETFTDR